jgi:ferredoxin
MADCPDVFGVTDEGYSLVLLPEIPDEFVAAARRAADGCPEFAITVRADDSETGPA